MNWAYVAGWLGAAVVTFIAMSLIFGISIIDLIVGFAVGGILILLKR